MIMFWIAQSLLCKALAILRLRLAKTTKLCFVVAVATRPSLRAERSNPELRENYCLFVYEGVDARFVFPLSVSSCESAFTTGSSAASEAASRLSES